MEPKSINLTIDQLCQILGSKACFELGIPTQRVHVDMRITFDSDNKWDGMKVTISDCQDK